jgi:hypothetical protein
MGMTRQLLLDRGITSSCIQFGFWTVWYEMGWESRYVIAYCENFTSICAHGRDRQDRVQKEHSFRLYSLRIV